MIPPPPAVVAVVAADAPSAAPVVAPVTAQAGTVLFHRRSAFQDVYVVDDDGERVLRFGAADGHDQSAIDPARPERLVFEYVRIATLGPQLVPLPTGVVAPRGASLRRALVVGLGGGSFPAWLVRHDPGVVVDVVEIDPVVVDVARRFFALPATPRLIVHTADGAAFVARARAGYDLVLLDAFGGDGIPAAVSSRAFFADVRRVLADDGLVLLNVALVAPEAAREIAARFTAVFPGCVVVHGRREDNAVLFGGRRPVDAAQVVAAAARATVALDVDIREDIGALRGCP